MIYVGMDISTESPAMCIDNDGNLEFIGYYREDKKLTKAQKNQIEFLNNLNNSSIKILKPKHTDIRYSSQENLDLLDGIFSMQTIAEELDKYNPEELLVGIEGFSYGSVGSSSSKLYGYQYLLRYFLYSRNISWSVYAPTTVKKTAGHGRFKKVEMIETFLNNPKQLDILIGSEFRIKLLDNLNIIKPSSKYLKPFEDLVDAFWVMESIKRAHKQNKI